eukprot:gene10134-13633_t
MNNLNELSCFLESWVNGGTLPGAVLGLYNSAGKELFYHECCNSNTAVKRYERSTIFRIYSMTKPITTIAIMKLIENGHISLDDEVSKWIPSFTNSTVLIGGTLENPITEPISTKMTIRHLLTHTSGISYGIFNSKTLHDQLLQNSVPNNDWQNWFQNTDLETLSENVAHSPLCFQPGTKFHYGLSIDILGRIIEVVSKMSLREYFLNEILGPLDMIDTDFFVPEDKFSRLADCYDATSSFGFQPSSHPERQRERCPTFLSGGGGLVSTLNDLSHFVNCLLNKGSYNGNQIISRESCELMMTNQLPHDLNMVDMAFEMGFSEFYGGGCGFGFGGYVITDPVVAKGGSLSGRGEYGWGGVGSTFFYVDPEKDLAMIFLTQLIPSSSNPIRAQLRWLSHHIISSNSSSNT